MSERTQDDPRDAAIGAAGAGAFGLALAELADVAHVRFAPAPDEAIAAVALMGLAGALLGGVLGLLWLRTDVLPRPTSTGLVAAASALCAATLSAGVLFFLGGALHLRYLGAVTGLGVVAPPLVFVIVAAAARQLRPRRLAALPLARTGAWLWAGVLACLLLAGTHGLRDDHFGPAFAILAVGLGLLAALLRWRPGHAPPDGLIGLVLALLATWPAPAAPPPSSPHPAPGSVVVLLLDTTRTGALGAYGAAPGTTPVLDALAGEGAVFEEMVSPSPWTAPSHASMFTGLYPRTHGVRHGTARRLEPGFETTAERLAAAGYQTAVVSSNSWLRVTDIVQGFEHFEEVNHLRRDKLILSRLMRYTGIGWEQWIDQGAAEAETAVASWMAGLDPERPFFLFVNLFEAHNPYLAPLRDRAEEGWGGWLRGIRAIRRFHPVRWHSNPPREPWRVEATRGLYRSGVRYQDRRVGRILEVIRRRVALDDVLLVVTSDHGDNLGEAERWGHQFDLNDALIRVPFLVRAPGVFEAGSRVAGAHQTLDLHATLLDWAGLEPGDGPSRSLLPDRRRAREATFAEVYPDFSMLSRIDPGGGMRPRDFDTPVWAVRRGDHKLVVRRGASALYDLRADPDEAHDRSGDDPERAAALRRELDAWLERHPGPTPSPGPGHANPTAPDALDAETRRQLEALGYM